MGLYRDNGDSIFRVVFGIYMNEGKENGTKWLVRIGVRVYYVSGHAFPGCQEPRLMNPPVKPETLNRPFDRTNRCDARNG